jgi:hypothetical protein
VGYQSLVAQLLLTGVYTNYDLGRGSLRGCECNGDISTVRVVSTCNPTVYTRHVALEATLRAFSILLLFSVGIAVAQTDVGFRLKSTQVPKGNTNECAATPSQTYPCLQNVTLNGVRFSVIGYDRQTRRIKYLLTSDEHFVTKDGLRVGAFVEIAEDKLLSIRGWHIYGPTTMDGWHTIVGSSLTEETLKSAAGSTVNPSEPVTGRVHRFEVLGFEKGGR